MKNKPSTASRLYQLQPRDGAVSIDRLVLECIHLENGKLTLYDEEEVAKNSAFFFDYIMRREDSLGRRGLSPIFKVVDKESYLLCWSAYQMNSPILRNKANLAAAVLDYIERADSRKFEFLSGVACRSLGADSVCVTPENADDSVDFYAVVPAFTTSPLLCTGRHGLRIIGQSKKFSTKLTEDPVMILAKAIDMIKSRSPKFTVPSWFYASSAPIVGWIVGHSGFYSGCVDMCRDNGIIMTDGIELAQIISVPKRFNFQSTRAGIFDVLESEISALKSA